MSVVTAERACLDCTVTVTDGFARCESCRARRRHSRKNRTARLDLIASDPGPAIIVRQNLLWMRRRGLPFPAAYRDAVNIALAEVSARLDRRAWMAAFRSTEDAWHRAYDREPMSVTLSQLAEDEPEHPHRGYTVIC